MLSFEDEPKEETPRALIVILCACRYMGNPSDFVLQLDLLSYNDPFRGTSDETQSQSLKMDQSIEFMTSESHSRERNRELQSTGLECVANFGIR